MNNLLGTVVGATVCLLNKTLLSKKETPRTHHETASHILSIRIGFSEPSGKGNSWLCIGKHQKQEYIFMVGMPQPYPKYHLTMPGNHESIRNGLKTSFSFERRIDCQ
jgi:hypothetical protein